MQRLPRILTKCQDNKVANERLVYLEYKDKLIVKLVYRGLDSRGMIALYREACKIGLDNPGKYSLLADFSHAQIDPQFLACLQTRETKLASKAYARVAATGLSGLRRLFLHMYNKTTKSDVISFPGENEALEYLVKCC